MADPLTSSYVQELSNMMSGPSSNSEDVNSTCSCNRECHCEEQYQPKKSKKRQKKISHMIKYVVGFSYVKKLKITKKSHKKRRDNNNDKTSSPVITTFQRLNSEPSKSSSINDHSPSMSPFTSFKDDEFEPNDEKSTIVTSSKWRIFGLVGMHHIMLMIILAALALSGKACAIFATIVWLILWPLTSRFSHGRRPRWPLQLQRNCDEKDLMDKKFMARF